MRVCAQPSPSGGVLQLRSTGMIAAPPERVWSVLKSLDDYASFMPFTVEARVVRREGEKVVFFYSRIQPPLVSARDYFIKLVDESQWNDGKGFLKVTWTVADPSGKMALADDVVHIATNSGSWLLEPRDAGKSTFLAYDILIVPGGSIPDVIANRANAMSVQSVFQAVKRRAEQLPEGR
ncbi:MAG: SRPBCC family protein [Myxococcaceae bacterium]|nr:SRPBCC family protein [Myxococcaceae bacterium]MCA3013880.1 SRPBCC family protein [Myxococcaceae bacterium]